MDEDRRRLLLDTLQGVAIVAAGAVAVAGAVLGEWVVCGLAAVNGVLVWINRREHWERERTETALRYVQSAYSLAAWRADQAEAADRWHRELLRMLDPGERGSGAGSGPH